MTELICITCPKGCHLKVDENNDFAVTGNSCPRGAEYGKNELKNPVRVLTSTVRTTSKEYPRCPVKTKGAIPKDKMFETMSLLDNITLTPPIKLGDIVIENILNTGINLVTCKDIKR
jgi:CxxC motif-containing protein